MAHTPSKEWQCCASRGWAQWFQQSGNLGCLVLGFWRWIQKRGLVPYSGFEASCLSLPSACLELTSLAQGSCRPKMSSAARCRLLVHARAMSRIRFLYGNLKSSTDWWNGSKKCVGGWQIAVITAARWVGAESAISFVARRGFVENALSVHGEVSRADSYQASWNSFPRLVSHLRNGWYL